MFPPLAYLDWIEGRPEAATHDLGSSDLRRVDPESDPIPERLEGLEDPETGPTVRRSVAAEYGVDPDQVLLAAGATHANLIVAAAALGIAEDQSGVAPPDRETPPQVLVERPGYEPLVKTPRALGGRVDRFLRPLPEAGLHPERVANAADPQLALVTVTNRHNPTGALTDRESLAAVADVAADNDAYLLVDEVYGPYVPGAADGHRGAFGGPTAAGVERTIVTGSLTKFHGLGDLRVGWIIGPTEFIAHAADVASHFPAISGPSTALARRFFHHRDRLVEASRDHLRTNADLLSAFVNRRDDLTGPIPTGSPYGLVTHSDCDGDTLSEAAWKAGVLIVPGRFFGVPASVRVSLGRGPTHTEEALDAFGAVLDDL